MQLVSYNIQYAKGQDGKFSIERIADVVATGDIICLQEVECHVERSGDIDQARRLGELLPRHQRESTMLPKVRRRRLTVPSAATPEPSTSMAGP